MMEKKLNFEEIKSLIRGAVSIVKTEDGIQMQRFTDPQFHAYDNNIDHQNKTRASAGMVMDFITNAKRFVMNYQIRYGSSRVFSYFDVTVNDVPYSFQGTDDYKKEPERTLDLTLDGKENHIRIYFPCLTQIVIRDVTLYDVTALTPVYRKKIMLAFGDSITQGYDAKHPMKAYAMAVADAFSADLYNKAIGGERFLPSLLNTPDAIDPDFITVAYGTNDWSCCTRAAIENNTIGFFRNLNVLYADKPVFVILPLWRKDHDRPTESGPFEDVRTFIRQTAETYSNIHVIDGFELMPHDTALFSDGRLHPDDNGFSYMSKALTEKIKAILC